MGWFENLSQKKRESKSIAEKHFDEEAVSLQQKMEGVAESRKKRLTRRTGQENRRSQRNE
jgi:hypothetical protein